MPDRVGAPDAAVDGDAEARDVAAQVHAEGGDFPRLARRPPLVVGVAVVAELAGPELTIGNLVAAASGLDRTDRPAVDLPGDPPAPSHHRQETA